MDENSVVDQLARLVEQNESGVFIDVPKRISEVKASAMILEEYVTGGKVTYKLHDPFPSMGVVSIEGKRIRFKDSDCFTAVATLASNVEVYAKLNGSVHIDFTFHGIARGK